MRLFLFFIVVILSSCNVLSYKHLRNFHESSSIQNTREFYLIQEISYNKPNVIDEEYFHNLDIVFKDIAAVKAKKVIDLSNDTNIVKCQYSKVSVWNWESESTEISGKIKILSWDTTGIKLKENIVVHFVGSGKTLRYHGTRFFKYQ